MKKKREKRNQREAGAFNPQLLAQSKSIIVLLIAVSFEFQILNWNTSQIAYFEIPIHVRNMELRIAQL